MNTKRTLATLISASLLTLAAVPFAQAGEPKAVVNETMDPATAVQVETTKPESDLQKAADNAAEAVTDTWIQGKLEASLMADESLSAFAIDTEVEDGVATLSGSVDSEADRDLATQIAMSIEGVISVQNTLVVQPTESISQS